MWRDLFRRHCSDETLLAHADGELPVKQTGVTRHLRSCWRCRARMAELEEQARLLATVFEEQTFPGPQRIVAAQGRFWARVEQYERSLAPAPEFRLMAPALGFHWWAAAACALLLAGGLIIRGWPHPTPKPEEVLAAMRNVEQELLRPALPLHQELRVEIRQTRPARSWRTSHLQVWNDAGGALSYAAWRAEDNPDWVYAPAAHRIAYKGAKVPSLALVGEHGWAPEDMEPAFFDWVRSRERTLVSLASDFRAFSLENAVTAGVRRIREPDGSTVFRLWARRDIGGGRMEIIVDVDAVTYRPRVQAVRFESAAREVELRLISERMEIASSAPGPFRERIEARLRPPAVKPNRPPVTPQLQGSELAPSRAELDRAELEVLYALHRARACLGEPIQVERGRDGKIRVQGLVETAARRAQIASILGELNAAQIVTVDLRTTEEAAVTAEYVTEGLVEVTRVGPAPLPIQDALEKYFAGRQGTGQAITELANQAVSASKDVSEEAWALRRLAERFGQGGMNDLRLESKWLLEVMIRDHAEALLQHVTRSRKLLEPVLSLAAGGKQAPPVERDEEGHFWNAVFSLFSLADETGALVQGLFAGGGLPLERDPSATGRMRLMAGDEVAAKLDSVLSELAKRLDGFGGLVSREFSGRPRLQSAK